MRWPWRGRGRHAKGRVVFIGRSPFDPPLELPDELLHPQDRHEPVAVRLGFSDGTELALPADDPRVASMTAAAEVLTRRDA